MRFRDYGRGRGMAIAGLVFSFLLAWLLLKAGSASASESVNMEQIEPGQTSSAGRLTFQRQMPSLKGGGEWIGSAPISPADLKGKVVLVQFGTYTCINWRRQLPYVRAWNEKYKKNGLVVVGVHTPEFTFEKDNANVRRALGEIQTGFPMVMDNDYAIWEAFDNNAWPALYFVDAKGRIRHVQLGEGDYERSESVLQQLISESGNREFDKTFVSIEPRGAEAQADWEDLRSQELYLGSDRTENFASGKLRRNQVAVYEAPARLKNGAWGLAGEWNVGKEAIVVNKPGSQFLIQFHARDLHLVMGPVSSGAPVRFRVLLDGKAPAESHGVDVDEQGNGTIDQPRMYQLIRQKGPIGDKQVQIEFLDAGGQAYSVTFG